MSACAPDTTRSNLYFRFSENDIDRLDKLFNASTELNSTVKFNSGGGKTSIALRYADIIKSKKVNLLITKECLSNCAELILPAANAIFFKEFPLIGFHGNDISYRYYVSNYAIKDKENCNWIYAREQEELLKLKSLKIDFWKLQMDKLKPKIDFLYSAEECPWRVYNFTNHIWLPDSEQLKNLWGLQFEGQVCSDNIEKCKKRIDRRWKKNTRIVLGDKIYVSKGH